jgi:UDP-glucose 4-epimerase
MLPFPYRQITKSCSICGEPSKVPITENYPQNMINPYGRTTLMVEQILSDLNNAFGLNFISLRYFNAAGADPDGEIGEDHNPETHLIPQVFYTALGKKDHVCIFGDDYPTLDGTCVRDYIHNSDLVDANLSALKSY